MPYPTLAPSNTWYKGTTARSAITEIRIADRYTGTGSEVWNADVNNSGSIKCHVNGTVLTIAGNGTGKIYMNPDSSNVFAAFTKMNAFHGAALLDTAKVTTLNRAFYDANALLTLDLTSWDTSNVEDLTAAFNGMLVLHTLKVSNWNTSKVKNMTGIFQCCVSLTELDLSGWETDCIETMKQMFSGVSDFGGPMALTRIIGLENWNTEKVTDMAYAFMLCPRLTELDLSGWNTSSVITMQSMFQGCTSLKQISVSNEWLTKNVTNSKNMFYNCLQLVGGAGTVYNADFVDKSYAVLDNADSSPGYLTYMGRKVAAKTHSLWMVADAVRTVTSEAPSHTIAEMVTALREYAHSEDSTGGAPVVEKDVNFYDYDGTLLYAYTLEELQALTQLPPLPEREGLVCQGWNWSLSDLKAYGKPYDVLPYYITGDGATWYDLVNDTGRNVTVTFRWKQYAGYEQPALDFGDGSETFTKAVTRNETVVCTHTYAPGNYRAKLSGFYHLGDANAVSDIADDRNTLLKGVFFGESPVYLYPYTFRNSARLETVACTNKIVIDGGQAFIACRNLKALPVYRNAPSLPGSVVNDCVSMKVVSIANGIAGHYGFTAMRSVKRLCIPDTCVRFNGNFADLEALTYVNIPEGTTSIPNNAFLRCYSLAKLDIPDTVTTIGSQAFLNCSSLYTLRFHSATPPTVSNANAFSGIPASCVVQVPASALNTYKNATNYGTIAAQMVGV